MLAARPSPLHRLLTVGIAALFVMLSALVVASPASAHDSLISSDPAADSSVETLPGEISLSFSAALLTMSPQDTVIDVLSPSGEDVSEGDAVVDGAIVRQQLGNAPEPGEYTVNWHVVSSDGHPTEGTFSFTVENASAPAETAAPVPPANDETTTAEPSRKPATMPTPTSSETTAPAGDEDEDRPFGELLPWILLGVTGIAIVGALTALLISRGRGADGDGADGGDGDPEPR